VTIVVGLEVGFLLGGAVLVEVVFGWLGRRLLIINGILQHDFPVVQAGCWPSPSATCWSI
jgi:ABC-type dipeptide/oligopeptide/nickel transport system permease component